VVCGSGNTPNCIRPLRKASSLTAGRAGVFPSPCRRHAQAQHRRGGGLPSLSSRSRGPGRLGVAVFARLPLARVASRRLCWKGGLLATRTVGPLGRSSDASQRSPVVRAPFVGSASSSATAAPSARGRHSHRRSRCLSAVPVGLHTPSARELTCDDGPDFLQPRGGGRRG